MIVKALEQFPATPTSSTRAMLAEKRGDLNGLERDLRDIIAREPDNATASMPSATPRPTAPAATEEAKALIEQAHQLNPEDAATLDSLAGSIIAWAT